MKKTLSGILLLISIQFNAQDSTRSLSFSSYVESYYTYDFNTPADNNRPAFIYSHNRHNEFNINLAFLKATYRTSRIRANLGFAAGTYMNANYTAEPGVLKNILEANAGLRLGKKDLWVDAGIFSSHIGFESAVSKECLNLSRSILADNSPYFEAGAKLTYTSTNGKWLFSILALNGWQRIKRVSGNSLISWGTQIQFRPTDGILLNSSTFAGTDKPDSARLCRYFHNFYGTFNVTDEIGIVIGFDIGTEERDPVSNSINTWYSPVVILKYAFNTKWAVAGRCEYYSDKNEVIIVTGTSHGFRTTGISFNMDYSPAKNVIVRLEWKNFYSKDPIFETGAGISKRNTSVTSSIALSL